MVDDERVNVIISCDVIVNHITTNDHIHSLIIRPCLVACPFPLPPAEQLWLLLLLLQLLLLQLRLLLLQLKLLLLLQLLVLLLQLMLLVQLVLLVQL